MSTTLPPPLRNLPPWVAPLFWLGVALLLYVLADVLLLIFAALLLAIVLRTLAEPLSRRLPLSDRVALVLVVIAVLAALGAVAAMFGAELRAQLADLGERLPRAWDEFRQHLGQSRIGSTVLDWLQKSLADGNTGSSVAARVGQAMSALTGTAANLVLVLVGAVYFAAQPGVYWRGAIGMLPPEWRGGAKDLLTSTGNALRRWLLAQLAAMALVGLLTGIGCALLGLPSALALGLFAALTEFVPVVGPVIAAVPALLLALTHSTELALWTALLYLAVQQVEGNLIAPLLIHNVVSVPPAATLFAILAFGVLFGLMGVLLAAPLAVTVHVVVTQFWARRLPPPAPAAPN